MQRTRTRTGALSAVACLTVATMVGLAGAADLTAVERVRAAIGDIHGSHKWGAEPPREDIGTRGMLLSATTLRGYGHETVELGKKGRPLGTHLVLRHTRLARRRATTYRCVLGLGRGERACPPARSAAVTCTLGTGPAKPVVAALFEARHALFVRVFEKTYRDGPREEREDGMGRGGLGLSGMSSSGDFVAAVRLVEQGTEVRVRVSDEWAGYPSSFEAGEYVRVVVAADLLAEKLPKTEREPTHDGELASVRREFTRLFHSLPLDSEHWWWVRERMVLMAGYLGGDGEVPRLVAYLEPPGSDASELRTRTYALESLALLTGTDTRCDGSTRRTDVKAAAAWLDRHSTAH